MMYPRLMLISQALLLLLVVESSWALSCMYCDRLSCPEVLQCPGGKVLEPCGCCYECAKQKGEICGGPFDESGTCDEGLQCVRHRRQVYSDGVCKEVTNESTTQPPETTTPDKHKGRIYAKDLMEWLKSMKGKPMPNRWWEVYQEKKEV